MWIALNEDPTFRVWCVLRLLQWKITLFQVSGQHHLSFFSRYVLGCSSSTVFWNKTIFVFIIQQCSPRRHLTLVPEEDTESMANVEQSPRAYRATRNNVSNLSATNTSFSELHRVVPPSRRINRSRLCVIQWCNVISFLKLRIHFFLIKALHSNVKMSRTM